MNRECGLDIIFCFLMKSILRKNKYGLDGLIDDMEGVSEEVMSLLSKGLGLVKKGETPVIIDILLEQEIYCLGRKKDISGEVMLQMILVKRSILWVQNDELESFLDTMNMWRDDARKYFSLTFVPNLPLEVREKYGLNEFIQYIPEELLELDNF